MWLSPAQPATRLLQSHTLQRNLNETRRAVKAQFFFMLLPVASWKPSPTYDGDGKTDLTVFRRGTSTWRILKSSNSVTQTQEWGAGTDSPVPGDYDGDSKAALAVWRPSYGTFYVLRSSNGTAVTQTWGQAGDVPILSSGIPTPAPLGTLTISGQVSNAQGSGGLGGVVLTLSGSLGTQTVTDSNGNYSFTGVPSGGSYNVVPSQNGFSITPGSRLYANLTSNVTNANFSGVATVQRVPV
jgi:hypothetical protein